MNFRELFWMLGFKPKVQEYGIRQDSFELAKDGKVDFANWLHPKAGFCTPNQPEIDELRKYIKPGDVGIDIGAYIGDTAFPMAMAAGKTGTVFALEPNKYAYKITAANAALNKNVTNIIPLPFAATPEDCEMEFEYSDPGFCNGGYHEGISKWIHGHAFNLKVTGKNLADYLQKNHPDLINKITFIKVDAEGYDLSVLRSIESIIKQARPYIRAEIFKKSNLKYRKEFYQFLKGLGYTIYLFDGAENFQGIPLKEEDMNNWKHFDIFAKP